jgi:hypothetical protein
MFVFVRYFRERYFAKSRGWGRPWTRCLTLDALLFASRRTMTLHSSRFRRWCREVNRLFVVRYDWPGHMIEDTGPDCWIDGYWEGMTPEEAVDSEVEHWSD